jgi:hypothetical protein
MKLKEFNTENCTGLRTRTSAPAITVDTKTGCNRINGAASELIGLSDGDQVKFHQDEDEEGDWYMEKVKDGGFELRKGPAGSTLLFNNVKLSKKIAESVAFEGRSGKCLIAGKPTEFQKRKLFGVLTSGLRNQ